MVWLVVLVQGVHVAVDVEGDLMISVIIKADIRKSSKSSNRYRVVKKICVLFLIIFIFATSQSPALGCYGLYRKCPPIGVTVQ